MKRTMIIIAITGLLFSCFQKPHSNFSVRNDCGSAIFVQYCYNTTIYSCDGLPTWSTPQTVLIFKNSTKQLWSTESINGDGKPDWWSNYQISIDHITNVNGDTITVDPNIPASWVSNISGTSYDYVLKVNEQSF